MPRSGLVMLKRRSEFLRTRNGLRWATGAFVLEAKSREGAALLAPVPGDVARFGLTVTKQIGSAVDRNRVRRRLRAAVQQNAPLHAKPGFDYVVIARDKAKSDVFARLVEDLATALRNIHTRSAQPRPAKRGNGRGKSPPA